jgi:hypothetical protein
LQAANACRYWPTGRGIFHNDKKTFLIWANEEDHLRIISMQAGGNVGEVLGRLIKGVNYIGGLYWGDVLTRSLIIFRLKGSILA